MRSEGWIAVLWMFFLFGFDGNEKVKIVGQKPLSTRQGQPITVNLSDLVVEDQEKQYPEGFTIKLFDGPNYTISGNTVVPAADFKGTLNVPVRVEAEKRKSEKFTLKIDVTPAANVRPEIIGQVSLATTEGKPVTLHLSHLTVADPDNNYPQDFTLNVLPGANYTVSGTTVTPNAGFKGTLTVEVRVNDGSSDSDPFAFKIQVTESSELQILGQVPLEINEDSTITLRLEHLVVNDPANKYPDGFSLNVLSGENYSVQSATISPGKNFNGKLQVGITISTGQSVSQPFKLLILVKAVNDPPEFTHFDSRLMTYNVLGNGLYLANDVEVNDVDDSELTLAEIGIEPEHFQSGVDALIFEPRTGIRGVFDDEFGILSLIGPASLSDFQEAIRSVQYRHLVADSLPLVETKKIYFLLNDGKSLSDRYEKQIMFRDDIQLDIPSAFTPNGDHANDTWKIMPLSESVLDNAIIRVYNRRGQLVHEAAGFEKEWDGKYNGEALPSDTYFYVIEVNQKNVKGIVTILK